MELRYFIGSHFNKWVVYICLKGRIHPLVFDATSYVYVICLVVLPSAIDATKICHSEEGSVYYSLLASRSGTYWLLEVSLFYRVGILNFKLKTLEILVMHFELSYEFHQNLLEYFPEINKVALSFVPCVSISFLNIRSEDRRLIKYLYQSHFQTQLL